MADQVCVNCNAFEPGENHIGECHAHPPVPLFGGQFGQPGSGTPQLECYWPEVADEDWCREWKPAPGPLAK